MPSSRPNCTMDSWVFFQMIIFLLIAGGQLDKRVIQDPSYLVSRTGHSVLLECDPISEHFGAFWYRQLQGQGPELLFYFYNKQSNDKGNVSNRFTANYTKNFKLHIHSVEQGDSALYLCASRGDGGRNTELHFGKGTRLIVLDDLTKVTPPKVTVFQPSEEEIEKKGKATLVCLATGFYPDLVQLTWWVNGEETKIGVSTDPKPSKEQPQDSFSYYTLSSRLRVSAPFWRNPKNNFRCQVLFHGISENETWTNNESKPITQNVSDQLWGRADCGITSESYQRSIQSATFFYVILLGKAMLYGLLVSVLVWRTMAKEKHS